MQRDTLPDLLAAIRACSLCPLPFGPRPIVQAGAGARLLIIGQAPGARVHNSGVPWDDDSGDRLRDWLAIDKALFYDPERVALMPMGFCYPGSRKGGDAPPRPECAPLWHERLRAALPNIALTLYVGSYAHARYLPARTGVTEAVAANAQRTDGSFALPHPAWRVVRWMKQNPWFETETLPRLRAEVRRVLG